MADGDRLPWLGPLSERSAAPGPRAVVRGLTIIIVLLALALMGTLALLFLRQADAPVAPPAAPLPAAKVDLPVTKEAAPAPLPILPPATQAPAPVARLAEAPAPRARPPSVSKKASVKRTSARKPRAKPRRATPRRAAQAQVQSGTVVRNWPAVPWVGTPGSVIQLGAYSSPRQAHIAWRSSIRAYPYLATLPRVVTTVRVGSKRIRYYRLQLGTPSPVHASQTCRNLRSIRRSCIVT